MRGNGKRQVSKSKKKKTISTQKLPKPTKIQGTHKKFPKYKTDERPSYSRK